MVTMSDRSKLEFFLEQRLLASLLTLLQKQGVKGWTVLAAEQGRGGHGIWYGGEPTGVAAHAQVITVCRDEVADRVLEAVAPELEPLGMVVLRSRVAVLRPERF